MMDVFDLRAKAETRAPKLSGGMRRRLLLARALMHEPRLVILDEPTAGVDFELRLELWRYIRRLHEEGTTILLTTHYLEEAEELCEEIALIRDGRLIARDSADGLRAAYGADSLADVYVKAMAFSTRSRLMPIAWSGVPEDAHAVGGGAADADPQRVLRVPGGGALERRPADRHEGSRAQLALRRRRGGRCGAGGTVPAKRTREPARGVESETRKPTSGATCTQRLGARLLGRTSGRSPGSSRCRRGRRARSERIALGVRRPRSRCRTTVGERGRDGAGA